MNLRFEILRTVSANPGAPIEEIADALNHDRQKTARAVRDCAKDGLLAKRLDDVTRQPGYTLTAAGKKRLAEGPAKQTGSNLLKKAGSESEGGEIDVKAAADQPAEIPLDDSNQGVAAGLGDNADPEPGETRAVKLAVRNHNKRLDAQAEEFSLLGVIADIRAAIGDHEGLIMLGELAEHIRDLYELGEAHREACMNWERSMMAAIGEDGVGSVVEAIDKLKAEPAELRARRDADCLLISNACETLAPLVLGDIDTSDMDLQEIAERVAADVAVLQREAVRAAACQAGQDRAPVGYLVRTPKRPLRTFAKSESAQAAAMAAARNGSGRGEVFALVPVGAAVRGAEWRPA